jgi:hypothetical protein
VNAEVFESRGCPKSPCHQLHYTFEHCFRSEETGASLCATSITPERMVAAIMGLLGKASEAAA